MARPSGDGYNCLLGPHAHLYSQQALLSKGAPLQGRALPAPAVSVFPLLSALLSFLCDTARGGNMTLAAQPGSAQPRPLQPAWVFLPVPSSANCEANVELVRIMLHAAEEEGRKAQSQLRNRTECLSTDCLKLKNTDRPGPKPKGNTPLFHVCCEEAVCQCLVSHLKTPHDSDMKDVLSLSIFPVAETPCTS